eukprot:1158903-Pelagomonas_calceolata.AAC.20
MMFHKCMSMAKSSEHAAGPFMASAFRVRQFVFENYLANRPYVSLRLGKTYVAPAGMYAGQVWATDYIKVGKESASDLQVRHGLRRRDSFVQALLSCAVGHSYSNSRCRPLDRNERAPARFRAHTEGQDSSLRHSERSFAVLVMKFKMRLMPLWCAETQMLVP